MDPRGEAGTHENDCDDTVSQILPWEKQQSLQSYSLWTCQKACLLNSVAVTYKQYNFCCFPYTEVITTANLQRIFSLLKPPTCSTFQFQFDHFSSQNHTHFLFCIRIFYFLCLSLHILPIQPTAQQTSATMVIHSSIPPFLLQLHRGRRKEKCSAGRHAHTTPHTRAQLHKPKWVHCLHANHTLIPTHRTTCRWIRQHIQAGRCSQDSLHCRVWNCTDKETTHTNTHIYTLTQLITKPLPPSCALIIAVLTMASWADTDNNRNTHTHKHTYLHKYTCEDTTLILSHSLQAYPNCYFNIFQTLS